MTVAPNMMGREADRTGSGLYTIVGLGVNGVDALGSITVVWVSVIIESNLLHEGQNVR